MERIILHIDLDSFYAAVEERRNPSLRGKPVVVCMFSGRQEGGAVATANYEARKLGIRSGQPIRFAKARATPETVFLPADREFYKKVSDKIMALLRQHADSFEQRSIDEAYLDITKRSKGSYIKARETANKIKQDILDKEKLTCSVGIGPNKIIAKMASREKKPDGLTIVKPADIMAFLPGKPVDKLFGIGPKTLEALEKFHVKTIKDLSNLPKEALQKEFGERKGQLLFDHSRGIDNEPVVEVVGQQLSKIATLPENTKDFRKIFEKLSALAEELHQRVSRQEAKFRTVSIITINTHLEMKTRSITLESPSSQKEDILENSRALLRNFLKENPDEVLRRIGVRVSSLEYYKNENVKKQKALSDF